MEPDIPSRTDIAEAANIFHLAELEPQSTPFVAHLTDVDGEDALIRMDAVAMLTVPICIVEPSIDVEYDEEPDADE